MELYRLFICSSSSRRCSIRAETALIGPSLLVVVVVAVLSLLLGQIESRLANELNESVKGQFERAPMEEPSALTNDRIDPCLSSRMDFSRIIALRDGCLCRARTSIMWRPVGDTIAMDKCANIMSDTVRGTIVCHLLWNSIFLFVSEDIIDLLSI